MSQLHQLGRYHLIDRIAYGGMAEIYRAATFDADGHQVLVAVKRILPHLAMDDSFIEMLIDEAKIASVLRHPNIAQVYEFSKANNEYFLAMEWVDGKDLRTILKTLRKTNKSVPPEHVAYIGAQIASGMHVAHTAVDTNGQPLEIVHRDISPSNILCAYTGEVKLCDFGIAKGTLSKVNTKTGVIKGKIKYMSPEQAMGRRLDHRTDIFSLGSCLYHAVAGRPPFRAGNEMEVLVKVRDTDYPPLYEVAPHAPSELSDIIDKCLKRARADRYNVASELARDLTALTKRKYPGYVRSHFGRFMRSLFEAEIDAELRKMEDFVVTTSAIADVGENLIADKMGPQATYSKFSPQPTKAPPRDKTESPLELHRADTLILPNRRPG